MSFRKGPSDDSLIHIHNYHDLISGVVFFCVMALHGHVDEEKRRDSRVRVSSSLVYMFMELNLFLCCYSTQ